MFITSPINITCTAVGWARSFFSFPLSIFSTICRRFATWLDQISYILCRPHRMLWFWRYQNFRKEFFLNMLKPDIRHLHFPPYSSPPFPFWCRDKINFVSTHLILLLPPSPHPSYRLRMEQSRHLHISDLLGNDTYGEILTPPPRI